MTGRDLIIHILKHNMEDTVFTDEEFFKLIFMDENEAAAKYGVGTATVRAWYAIGALNGFKVGDTVLYHRNQENFHVI